MWLEDLIAPTITRPILPSLIGLGTIKFLLPEFLIDRVVPLAQPATQRRAAAHVRRMIFDIFTKINRTPAARVKDRQRS